jgi:hypothetical protein
MKRLISTILLVGAQVAAYGDKLLHLPMHPAFGVRKDKTVIPLQSSTDSVPLEDIDRYIFAVSVGMGTPAVNGTLLVMDDAH